MPSPRDLMQRAIDAATTGIAHGSGPFGALIVDAKDETVAVGVNMVITASDPTAHAEIVAIRRAAARRGRDALRECTLVTTCAPCVMCAGAIHWSGVKRVIAAARAADAEAIGFVEGPKGFDAVEFLRARGVTYHADVERDAAQALLRSYTGPIYG